MFKYILVPADFSEQSQHALEIAVQMALLPEAGHVVVLHIIEEMQHTEFEEFADFYKKLEQQAMDNMTSLITPYQGGKVNVHSVIVYGNRVQEILRFVTEHEIDLIVMNSHKVNMEEPGRGWGTISYKVGILAPCPVMLVK